MSNKDEGHRVPGYPAKINNTGPSHSVPGYPAKINNTGPSHSVPVQDEAWKAQQKENADYAIKCANAVLEDMTAQGDKFKSEYIEAMVASNEAGFSGMTAAETIRELSRMVSDAPQPAQQQEPDAIVTSLTAGPDGGRLPDAAASTAAEVHGMAEAHGIDGDARHWYVVGLADAQEKHKEKNT